MFHKRKLLSEKSIDRFLIWQFGMGSPCFYLVVAKADHQTIKFNSPPKYNFPAIKFTLTINFNDCPYLSLPIIHRESHCTAALPSYGS